MAFLFDDSNTEYMFLLQAIASSPPFSMASWFKSDDSSDWRCLMSMADNSSPHDYHQLQIGSSSASPARYVGAFTRSGAGQVYAQTSTGYTVDEWTHACGVWASTSDRRAYIDGGSKGTNSDARSPTPPDKTGIGCICDSTPSGYMSGLIAEAAIWGVALTDAEVAVLGAGYSPLFVRPESLLAYWPMVRQLGTGQGIELIQHKQLLVGIEPDNGPHCPIVYPSAIQPVRSRAPLAVIMQNYKKMRVA